MGYQPKRKKTKHPKEDFYLFTLICSSPSYYCSTCLRGEIPYLIDNVRCGPDLLNWNPFLSSYCTLQCIFHISILLCCCVSCWPQATSSFLQSQVNQCSWYTPRAVKAKDVIALNREVWIADTEPEAGLKQNAQRCISVGTACLKISFPLASPTSYITARMSNRQSHLLPSPLEVRGHTVLPKVSEALLNPPLFCFVIRVITDIHECMVFAVCMICLSVYTWLRWGGHSTFGSG